MKNQISGILIFVFASLIFGCKHKTDSKMSDFKVAQDYSEFFNKMENGDTLNIVVDLSICMWEEYDQLRITKSNDSVFIQLLEKRVMDDEPIFWRKVHYELKNDTLDLGKMMSDFDINHQEKTFTPFFIITNPKEKDTILLRTIGLGNRGFNIERYHRIMFELYPKEMEKYIFEHLIQPPEPIEIEETEMEK